jgi:HEAT repeat protein
MTLASIAALILFGMLGPAAAQQYSLGPKLNKFAQQGSNNTAITMFGAGRDLIDGAQWQKAEEQFARYVSAYPKEKNLDAAMYWMAYAEFKLNRFEQCRDTITRLLKAYENTTWKEDAQLLWAQLPNGVTGNNGPITVAVDSATAPQDPVDVQVRTQEAQERIAEARAKSEERTKEAQERMKERVKEAQERMKDKTVFRMDMRGLNGDSTSDDDPCEFKIVVLQALFESDPQRAISVATDWLKTGSTETVPCKSAALRLLARHGGKAATPTILGVAEREPDLKLRARAISALGSTTDDSVIDPLRNFALNSQQSELSEAALYALSENTSPRAITALTEIAMSTKPIALRKSAISAIANRSGEPAVDALFKIYDADQNIEIRKAVISGFAHRRSERAGSRLMEIANSGDNLELRRGAISAIARRNGVQAIEPLLKLYDTEKNEELKDQIIFALCYSNDQRVTHKLIEIARNPQAPMERRKRAISCLSRSKDPEVLKLLEDLLKQ